MAQGAADGQSKRAAVPAAHLPSAKMSRRACDKSSSPALVQGTEEEAARCRLLQPSEDPFPWVWENPALLRPQDFSSRL